MNAIIEHSKNFKEFNRLNIMKIGKMAKGVMNWHSNTERIQKKEQERLEKERLKLLMAEDEEGYLKLLNEKKDKRLVYLLSQTDEYINSLTQLVKDHQDNMFKQKKDKKKKSKNENGEGESEDRHVKVTYSATGEVLEGKEAPLESELDAWLEAHPGWMVVPREVDEEDDDDDDDDDNSKDNKEESKKKGNGGESSDVAVSQ